VSFTVAIGVSGRSLSPQELACSSPAILQTLVNAGHADRVEFLG